MEQVIAKKPSFFGSVMSGITGFIKGALAGGVVGAIGGVAIGAAVAAIGMLTGGTGFVFGALGAPALAGAMIGAATAGSVGAAAGTMTGVVRHLEAAQPSAQDVVGVAKITFGQGVAVGHQIAQAEQAEQDIGKALMGDKPFKFTAFSKAFENEKKWQEKVEKERAAQAAQQRVH